MGTSLNSIEIDLQKPVELATDIWWVGQMLESDLLQCHPYLIVDGKESILIDPGSLITYEATIEKIRSIIPLDNIKYIICHHQDPDVTAVLPRLEKEISRDDLTIFSHWRTIEVLVHYNLKTPFQCVEKHFWELRTSKRLLKFLLTPYAHFAGSFCTYDSKSKILFSSDIFGGFSQQKRLFAKDESHLDNIIPFHEQYMPSREILTQSLNRMEKFPIKMVAPQHGCIIPESLVKFMFEGLKKVECGLYMMTQTSTDVSLLSDLNHLLRDFVEMMLTHTEFTDIAKESFQLLKDFFYASRVEFYSKLENNITIHYDSENLFQKTYVDIPEEFRDVIRQGKKEWFDKFGDKLYSIDIKKRIVLPLYDHSCNKVNAISIIQVSEHRIMPREVEDVLRQISTMLGIAIERESIFQTLDSERLKLYEISIMDPLTGLYNRVYMHDSIKRLFNIHDRSPDAPVIVISLDIDHFKNINDTYGHQCGDTVLKAIAEVIRNSSRQSDISVRVGGEEFSVFLVSNSLRTAYNIAERIRADVESYKFTGPLKDLQVTISSGIAMRRQKENFNSVMDRADKALYSAKNAGRNRIVVNEEVQ